MVIQREVPDIDIGDFAETSQLIISLEMEVAVVPWACTLQLGILTPFHIEMGRNTPQLGDLQTFLCRLFLIAEQRK